MVHHQKMALLVIFILSLPLLLFFLLSKHKTRKILRRPPGPPGLPFIGNLHQFAKPNPQRHLWNLSKQYGDLMSLRLGFVPTLIVSSAKMAKEVMKTHDLQFCSRATFVAQQKLSYNGSDLALAPYNDYWREMRKICVVHLFNSIKVQQFRPIREDEVFRMIEKISKLDVACKPVNISEITVSLTITIICRVVYVNAWAIGRDPQVWDNPEEFDPDRFLGSSIDFKGQRFELTPFGAGRRICPGIFMGIATVELTLATNLLCKFDWEMPAGMKKADLDFDGLPGLVMHKKNPLLLMARNAL